jgi:hypothetical protein
MAIRHKRKSTSAYTWTSSDLLDGQIGMNTADGTIHLKKTDNTIKTIGNTNGTLTAIGVTTANGISGTSSGGATPNLTLSLGAITPSSVSPTGNLVMAGGQFIQGDFSSTPTSRTLLQSTVTNGNSGVLVVPNGSGLAASIGAENSSGVTNSYRGYLSCDNVSVTLGASVRGTGTALPMYISNNGTTGITLSTAGLVNIPTSLTVTGTASASNLSGTNTGDQTWITPTIQTVTYSASPTINWTSKDVSKITLTGNATITNSGAVDGQKIILQLIQGGSGGYTVTFTSDTKFGTSFASITLSTSVGAMDMIGMIYSAVNSKYNIVSFAAGY